jgi:hypothetical protein
MLGVEGTNNEQNVMTPYKKTENTAWQAMNRSFGAPQPTKDWQHSGYGSQRIPVFGKIYRVVRLKSSIIVIRKFFPICLQRFKGQLLKNASMS